LDKTIHGYWFSVLKIIQIQQLPPGKQLKLSVEIRQQIQAGIKLWLYTGIVLRYSPNGRNNLLKNSRCSSGSLLP